MNCLRKYWGRMEHLVIIIVTAIITSVVGFLVNKFLNQCQQRIDLQHKINTTSSMDETNTAITEMHKHFDSRINKAFENHQLIKTELDSLKLQLGMKGNNNVR
jgi:uncharacterized membrane protein (DUF106 family)